MFRFLIEKEIKQFVRDSFMPRLVLALPIMVMLVLPWALDMGAKNVNLAIVDNDRTPYSERLAAKAVASEYFRNAGSEDSYSDAMELVERGTADLILEIPDGFEKGLVTAGAAVVQISANSVNGTKGMLGSTYLAQIVQSFAEELNRENGTAAVGAAPVIETSVQTRFNPQLDYKRFMIPALMVLVLTLLGGALPALNIVSEKEKGTIEQINVTPIPKVTFILAKLVCYWVMGIMVLSICLLIAWLLYGLVPSGNLLTVYAASVIYIVALSGFGIVISNYSENIQQAIFMIFFFLLILFLISGLFTPVRSMPQWAQAVTCIDPLRYYIEIIRSVYLKGSTAANLSLQFIAITCFAVILNVWAVLSYRKSR